MKRFIFLLVVAPLFMANAGVDAGNGTLSDELNKLFERNPHHEYEDQSFREYIFDFRLGDEAYVTTELARLDFQREVFEEYKRRWWRENDPESYQRDRYWTAYYEGKEWYFETVTSLGTANYCVGLKELLEAQIASDAKWRADAFRRGVVSEVPECWISGIDARIRGLFRKIGSLEKTLFEIQRKVTRARLDERQARELQKQLNESVKKTVLKTLRESEEPFLEGLQIAPIDKDVISAAAKIISVRIGCGDKCVVNFHEPAVTELTEAELYNYLDKGSDLVGQLQPRVDAMNLERKAAAYIREVNPNDQIVRGHLEILKSRLLKVDTLAAVRITNLRKRFARIKGEALEDLRLENVDFWQDLFPEDTRERVIQAFVELKFRMSTYERMLMGTQYEEFRFDEIVSLYNQALNVAAGVSMSIYMPERYFVLAVDPRTLEEHLLAVDAQLIPSGFLLGRDMSEVNTNTILLGYQ
jgi:hypothetical protein